MAENHKYITCYMLKNTNFQAFGEGALYMYLSFGTCSEVEINLVDTQ